LALPQAFTDRITNQLGDEAQYFLSCLVEEAPTSIRMNLQKSVNVEGLESVQWCPHAYYLPERPSFTSDPLFHAGVYYVQEASSMFLDYVFRNVVNLPDYAIVLDMCAAPGGKSTLLLDCLPKNNLLVCNEVIKPRAYILRDNLIKWGRVNAAVIQNDPAEIARTDLKFHAVVVDAPCSGEGLFRKDPESVNQWSEENVKICAARQKRILKAAYDALLPGGWLVYSTCTYNDEENMDNIHWAVNELNMYSLMIPLEKSWGLKSHSKESVYGIQFFPHLLSGEGFFISVLRKPEESQTESKLSVKNSFNSKLSKEEYNTLNDWIENPAAYHITKSPNSTVWLCRPEHALAIAYLSQNLRLLYSGNRAGSFKKNIFIPDHALALSEALSSKMGSVDLNLDQAQRFLSKQDFVLPEAQKSWLCMKYKGKGIGWVKNLGNRINNYLPQDFAIRNISVIQDEQLIKYSLKEKQG
jgi:16S rRNA C967 or C1407 C5-methylase (RsmB/RsmF family)/NOL1/NOP2/fmu family ribosome biogenesis protein